MVALRRLIEGCEANDALAWAKLFEIAECAALYPIRRLLRAHRFDESLDDDVLQELYRHLRAGSCKRLRAFRGTTVAELRVYLRTVAYRFARRLVAKWGRARKQEDMALRCATPPLRDGPTEPQIESARRELESVMPATDRDKLNRISENGVAPSGGSEVSSPAPLAVPDRTIRHWRLQLFRKYGAQL